MIPDLDDASLPPLLWFSVAEPDHAFSIYRLLCSLFFSLLNVSFPFWHRDCVWIDSFSCSSTILCNMRILMAFGYSAMPIGMLQEWLSRNHPRHPVDYSRRHGSAVIAIRTIIVILVQPLPLSPLPPFLLILTSVKASYALFA